MICSYCSRPLSSPASLARGSGPICASEGKCREIKLSGYKSEAKFLKKAQKNCLIEGTQGMIPKFFYKEGDKCILVKTVVGAKVDEFDFGHSDGGGVVEYACNRIADSLQMSISKYGLMPIGSDNKAFFTELFTHRWLSGKGEVEQYGHLVPLRHFVGGESDFKKLHKKVVELSAAPEVDSEKFVQMSIFDALIMGTDRHNENISMINLDGKLYLSPCYDNQSGVYGCCDEKELSTLTTKITSSGQRMNMVSCLYEAFEANPLAAEVFCERILSKRGEIYSALDAIDNQSLKNLFQTGLGKQMDVVESFLEERRELIAA